MSNHPIVCAHIGRSTWQGPADAAPVPQPAIPDREALVEVIRDARNAWLIDVNEGDSLHEYIADALLARGLRLPGNQKAVVTAEELFALFHAPDGGIVNEGAYVTDFLSRGEVTVDGGVDLEALASWFNKRGLGPVAEGGDAHPTDAQPETLAWAAVGDCGEIVWVCVDASRHIAERVADGEGGDAVRVAIRVLDDAEGNER